MPERKYIQGIGWVALTFTVLAVTFVFDFWGGKKEVVSHPPVDPKFYTKDSVRQARLKPEVIKEGYMYRCNDCHQNIIPSDVQKVHVSSHDNIVLNHGANNYCMTCHNRDNREMLKDINGGEVSFAKSETTCLQCHGTIYRDWQEGLHGRINGYWNTDKGEKLKLTCVQCHDPHDPKFKPMHPAPAPARKNYQEYLGSIQLKDSQDHGR